MCIRDRNKKATRPVPEEHADTPPPGEGEATEPMSDVTDMDDVDVEVVEDGQGGRKRAVVRTNFTEQEKERIIEFLQRHPVCTVLLARPSFLYRGHKRAPQLPGVHV